MDEVKVTDRRRFAGAAEGERIALARQPISLNDETEEVLADLIQRHQLTMSDEDKEKARQDIRARLVQQRVMYRNMLQRAQAELQKVSYAQLSVGDISVRARGTNTPVLRGTRQRFVITIGKFVYGREDTWLFEPTIDDISNRAMRFLKQSAAVHKGLLLRKQLSTTCEWDDEGKKIIREGWKDEMYKNIEDELLALEVE